jgi:hypothetical protein
LIPTIRGEILAIYTKRACNKSDERIAPWSTTVGDYSNFVRATRLMLRKLAATRSD